jgi:hypothetical protein
MEAGRLKKSSLVGLKAALVADIPNAVLCLLLLIGSMLQNVSANLFTVALFIDGFIWGSMYYGIVWTVAVGPVAGAAINNAWIVTLCYFLSLFVLPAVCHAGYVLGQKNFKLFRKNTATASKKQK